MQGRGVEEYGFGSLQVLKESDREGLQLLQKLARNVQVLMKRHGWKVPLLKECDFKDPCLLGMNINHGKTILIRLRRAGPSSSFYPYEHLLGTLCHELTHNVHGPHDAKFYKFLDELQTYLESLPYNGLSGFDAAGVKIGGDSSLHSKIVKSSSSSTTSSPNSYPLGKSPAALAAEYRAKQQQLFTPAGGVKLGGNRSLHLNKTPAQMAADAAIRREKDNIWCPTQENNDNNNSNSNSNVDKNANDTKNIWVCAMCTFINRVIKNKTSCEICGSQRSNSNNNGNNNDKSPLQQIHDDDDDDVDVEVITPPKTKIKLQDDSESNEFWQCSACTLYNPQK